MRRKIGECLVHAGLISDEELRSALAGRDGTGERIGEALVRLGFATERQIARALACQLGLAYTNFSHEPPDPSAVILIPREVASRRVSVAIRLKTNVLTVAVADPLQFGLIQDLEARTGHRVTPVVAARPDILHAIQIGYTPRRNVRYKGADRPLPDAAGM